jgi:subtilisin family serine protease
MKKTHRHLLTAFVVVFCGVLGWWGARDFEKTVASPLPSIKIESLVAAKSLLRRAAVRKDDERQNDPKVGIFASIGQDEVILRFSTTETYMAFLSALNGSQIHHFERLDPLRAIRISYDKWADLTNLLHGKNIVANDSLPSPPVPSPMGGENQTGLVEFGSGLLPWLGITGDNSRWGAGVTIAVVDTGIISNPALPGVIESFDITPFPSDITKANGHGTAVASLIAGNDPLAPGVAPAARLVSIRVGDDSGRADAFALAAGIVTAVDAGVQIINISMGTTENNPLIEDAVLYAHDHQVLIVAASGNSEQADACYPAAYPSVISVGAVDARGEHLDFSNFGTYLSLTAPGYAIDTVGPGNGYAKISGTSASAPIVTGAIAATMSNGGGVTMTASQAAEIVMQYSDEAGIPGPDSEYGVGILNVGRVMNRSTYGIVDAAITQQRIIKSGRSGASYEVQVTIQNRGTTVLINTLLEIKTPSDSRRFNVTTLVPGAVQTFSCPIRSNFLTDILSIPVSSSLTLGGPGKDVSPQNNQRSEKLRVR